MLEPIELLAIAPEKVAFLINLAREEDVKAVSSDGDGRSSLAGEGESPDLHGVPGDASRQAFREYLSGMNEDELASLIALVWIGRGTYAPAELDEAIATAKAEHHSTGPAYLFSLPLLPNYLEDALDQLGISVQDAEDSVLPPA